MGKIVIEGQKMTLQYSSPRFYWSKVTLHDVLAGLFAAPLVDRLSVVNRRVVGVRDFREFKIRRLRTTNYGWTSVVLCS